ncbi:uncharacterized protein TEOVI_000048000 [Trypanosoma equiperdum]|uniref:Uncharacterized protein n=1 Tax=Trypanosoma equiperdum TaxID=5694 RepID=A0A1G4I7H6_TRYEQ|nr:hypothetical protein, conserved [Trypanosoma equiperdum]
MHTGDKRVLPCFDNHYNSGVLVDNWFDARINEAHGKFTIAVDGQSPLPSSVYKADYSTPCVTAVRPMLRQRGLGKSLIFGSGLPTVDEVVATSKDYGATQRYLIDSRYGKPKHHCKPLNTLSGVDRFALTGKLSKPVNQPTVDDAMVDRFRTTKSAMDVTILNHHVQRQLSAGRNCGTRTQM